MLVSAEEEGGRAQSEGILHFLTSLRGLEGSFWVWRIGVKTIAVGGWVCCVGELLVVKVIRIAESSW